MLKKITSIEEINLDDCLLYGPTSEPTKLYQIKNVGKGYAYAVHEAEEINLKIITAYSLSNDNWWKKEKP